MAFTVSTTLDPYYDRARITHNAQTTVDSGLPTAIRNGIVVFHNIYGNNVIKCRAILSAGTATIRLKEYSGRLSELLGVETWINGAKFEIASGTTTLTPCWKFDTTGAIVAVYLEAIAGGGSFTMETVIGAIGVANS
jgi:hypothetical protein